MGLFCPAASLAAKADFFPNLFPLFTPNKWPSTGDTQLGRQILFFYTFHSHLFYLRRKFNGPRQFRHFWKFDAFFALLHLESHFWELFPEHRGSLLRNPKTETAIVLGLNFRVPPADQSCVIGGQEQNIFRSPWTLSIRATLGQNLCWRSHNAGQAAWVRV